MIINEELNIQFQDAGPWRSYSVETEGNTLEELLQNADIFETDQDGDTLRFYSLDDASAKIYEGALAIITEIYTKNAFKNAIGK